MTHFSNEVREKETIFWDGLVILIIGAIGIGTAFGILSYTRRQFKTKNSLEVEGLEYLQAVAEVLVSVSILLLFWGAIFIAIGRS